MTTQINNLLEYALRQIAVTRNDNAADKNACARISAIYHALWKCYHAIKNGENITIPTSDIIEQLRTVLALKKISALTINSIIQSVKTKNEMTEKYSLLCFPHAGGSAQIYHRWINEFYEKFTLIPIELPGHGSKMKSGFPIHLNQMLQLLHEAILPYLNSPYVFFGHSFGAFLAYELTLLLQEGDKSQPKHLFLSACGSPNQIHLVGQYMNNLNDADLWNLLFDLDGTDHSLRTTPGDFQQFYLKLLRSDIQLMAKYQVDISRKVNVPVTVHSYSADNAFIKLSMSDWREYCNGSFRMREFEGGHFSLLHSNDWLNDINDNI